MRYSPDIIAKYLWIALICVVIVIAVVVVFRPGEVRSECDFQYFFFLSQKMTPDSYSLELLDGVRDVTITGVMIDGNDLGISRQTIKAGDTFILTSAKDPTQLKADENFRYKVTILYDFAGGIENNRDVATCTGRVQ